MSARVSDDEREVIRQLRGDLLGQSDRVASSGRAKRKKSPRPITLNVSGGIHSSSVFILVGNDIIENGS